MKEGLIIRTKLHLHLQPAATLRHCGVVAGLSPHAGTRVSTMLDEGIFHCTIKITIHLEESSQSSNREIRQLAIEQGNILADRIFSDHLTFTNNAQPLTEKALRHLRNGHGVFLCFEAWAAPSKSEVDHTSKGLASGYWRLWGGGAWGRQEGWLERNEDGCARVA